MLSATPTGYQYLDTNPVWPGCLRIEIRCQLIQSVLIVKVSRVNNASQIILMYLPSFFCS